MKPKLIQWLFRSPKRWHLKTVASLIIVALILHWSYQFSVNACVWALCFIQTTTLIMACSAYFKHEETTQTRKPDSCPADVSGVDTGDQSKS
jgi:hypothetical protein